MDKSHVSMEQNLCMICGENYDTGAILLDRRLMKSMEMYTVTGNGICPEDQKKLDDGYLAMIVIDPTKSEINDAKVKFKDAHRTGEILFLRKTIAAVILNIEITSDILFIDQEAATKIKELTQLLRKSEEHENKET